MRYGILFSFHPFFPLFYLNYFSRALSHEVTISTKSFHVGVFVVDDDSLSEMKAPDRWGREKIWRSWDGRGREKMRVEGWVIGGSEQGNGDVVRGQRMEWFEIERELCKLTVRSRDFMYGC